MRKGGDWEDLRIAVDELRAAIGRSWMRRRLLWLCDQLVRLEGAAGRYWRAIAACAFFVGLALGVTIGHSQ